MVPVAATLEASSAVVLYCTPVMIVVQAICKVRDLYKKSKIIIETDKTNVGSLVQRALKESYACWTLVAGDGGLTTNFVLEILKGYLFMKRKLLVAVHSSFEKKFDVSTLCR